MFFEQGVLLLERIFFFLSKAYFINDNNLNNKINMILRLYLQNDY